MKGRWALKGVKMLGMVIIGSLAIGLLVMVLWNALVPELFHGPTLTFWQSVGLLVLSHILLRGWGPRGRGWHRGRWRFDEKLAAMTPEEREKFKQEWSRRCGWMPSESNVKHDA